MLISYRKFVSNYIDNVTLGLEVWEFSWKILKGRKLGRKLFTLRSVLFASCEARGTNASHSGVRSGIPCFPW